MNSFGSLFGKEDRKKIEVLLFGQSFIMQRKIRGYGQR